jgi:hypothetical protein
MAKITPSEYPLILAGLGGFAALKTSVLTIGTHIVSESSFPNRLDSELPDRIRRVQLGGRLPKNRHHGAQVPNLIFTQFPKQHRCPAIVLANCRIE